MKKCQVCGNENSDEMRFCLECGNALPSSPLVFNLQDSSGQKQSEINTVSYEKSIQTQPGNRNANFNDYLNVPPSNPQKSGKILLVLGGIAIVALLFLTAGAAIIAYNWDEIAKIFIKPTPTPQPTRTIDVKTPTPSPSASPSVAPTVFPTFAPSVSPTPPNPNPDVEVSFDKVWVDYNVTEKGRKGMLIHVKFSVKNLKGVSSYVAVYFQKKDGTSLTTNNPDFRSERGNLALFSSIKPDYDDTVYKDVQLFMPYDELNLSRGRHDLKMDIDLIYENGDIIEHLTYNDFWYEEK